MAFGTVPQARLAIFWLGALPWTYVDME